MTMKPISDMRRVCEAATDGPWRASDNYLHVQGSSECLAEFYGDNPMPGDSSNDTEFIAEARTQWPECIEMLTRARPFLEELLELYEEDLVGDPNDDESVIHRIELRELLEELLE